MTVINASHVVGVEVGSAAPVFLAVLAVHVLAGTTCVIVGAVAALSGKRRRRHPSAGRLYYISLVLVFASLVVLSVLRWPHDVDLLAIGTLAFTAATVGLVARRRRRPGWIRWHGTGMAVSYIALFTGFYVDNGPNLPLWNLLPHTTYWLLPSVIGIPLLLRALHRATASQRRKEIASTLVSPSRRKESVLMSELVEFDDFLQMETLLRAGILFKFEGAVEDENFGTSPIFGRALTQLLDGLVDGLRASGNFSKAKKFADWYQLALHTHRWSLISRRAAGHPKWDALSESERRDRIAVVAAPFKLDDDTFASIERSASEIYARPRPGSGE